MQTCKQEINLSGWQPDKPAFSQSFMMACLLSGNLASLIAGNPSCRLSILLAGQISCWLSCQQDGKLAVFQA